MDDLPLYLAILYSNDAPLVGRRWQLDSLPAVVTIGRDPANTLEIRSHTVSRCHARIERRADGWHIVDDTSTSGTWLNDERVTDALLRRDDKIRVGDTLLSIAQYIIENVYRPDAPDGLTGLATKRHVLPHLDAAMRSGARPLAVIRIDVDQLQVINADRGHEVGDRILADIGARLRASARPGEYPGRLSADDFVLVLPATDLRAANARATELRAQLSTIAPVSVGAAEAAPHHRDADELIYDAEKELWAQRKLSRSR